MLKRVAVTGGAGYIGSHTVKLLCRHGYEVYVLDNLSTGHRAAVPAGVVFHEIDLRDAERLNEVFARTNPEAVIHFAAHCYVGESVVNPRKYFEDNLTVSLNVLGAMLAAGARCFIFSSTCATYGEPREVPIPETHPQEPVNPYGESKYFIERILRRYDEAYGLRSIALRYFNAAGADPEGQLGESHVPETHLIPLMVRAICEPASTLTVFGDDYATPDGTCIRDYIHVTDLAQAHLVAMERLAAGASSNAYNLGTGQGFSVLEMIRELERLTGRPVKRRTGSRRPGDPPRLVALAEKARRELDWECRFSSIGSILESAWRWHQAPRY